MSWVDVEPNTGLCFALTESRVFCPTCKDILVSPVQVPELLAYDIRRDFVQPRLSARFLELGYQFADIDIIRFVFPPPVAFADDLQTEVKSPPASPEKPV